MEPGSIGVDFMTCKSHTMGKAKISGGTLSKGTIGSRIKGARETAGLTQMALGEKVGLHTSYISLIERDQKRASVSALRKIAAALEVAPEWLETGHPTAHYVGVFKEATFEDESQGGIDLFSRHRGHVRLTVEALGKK